MIADRIVLTELTARVGTTREAAARSGLSEADVLVQVRDLNERIKRELGYRDSEPLTVTGDGAWKADGVAGVVRLNDRVEIEIVPKFLDADDETWRRDFFLLAVLVRTGRLLLHDQIGADEADRGDLATLVAWSLLAACEENLRHPIRGYRRARAYDFAIDGDVDLETLLLPDPDGFRLDRLELSNRTPYNATICAAARILEHETADTDTQARLHLLARNLAPQDSSPRASAYPSLPLRHQNWAVAYDLARLVVDGLGLDLLRGQFTGPGFVLSTWRAWEQVCEEIVRAALPHHRVQGQRVWTLGTRASGRPANATPDITVVGRDQSARIFDAKYKTRLLHGKQAITSTDLYESHAFMTASGTTGIDLLYPATTSPATLGAWELFDEVNLSCGQTARGTHVQIRGIARRGGFAQLVNGARAALAP